MILVDAGPLIALIHEDDDEHQRCREAFAAMNEPLGTVWPAIADAVHLLSFASQAQEALWEMIETGAVEILPLGIDEIARMKVLMRKYRDLPMDLADGTLVALADLLEVPKVFTLDHKDFSIYRFKQKTRFTLIPSKI